jgi:hypothetical protein
MYQKGDKCDKCKRPIVKYICPLCDGSGKPNQNWVCVRSTCPSCNGRGFYHVCPASYLLPLAADLGGPQYEGPRSCKEIDDKEYAECAKALTKETS